MAGRKSRSKVKQPSAENLRKYIRQEGVRFLADENVTSVGIGYKVKDGKRSNEIAVQFTVRQKSDSVGLESLNTTELPETVNVAGARVPTDVLERDYQPAFNLVTNESLGDRRVRQNPVFPGISISHPKGSAGTLGLVVYDNLTGAPCALSNWHVLHTAGGEIGDQVVQPGPYDDNSTHDNGIGDLLRSHLGMAGDCAIAEIEDREFETDIYELGVTPRKMAKVELGDEVIKSGRTTGVTRGVVRRVDVVTKINYGAAGTKSIGAFEYEPLPGTSGDYEVSMGGDSGSAVMIAGKNGATDVIAGLHFAGEAGSNPDEHGIACYIHSVMKKLNVSLNEPEQNSLEAAALGFDRGFLEEYVRFPYLDQPAYDDAYKFDGSHLLHYMHFTVCQSMSRGLPRVVAWNIDGSRIKTLSRKGISFRRDRRVPAEFQHDNDLYKYNSLDRGHVARRAVLCWGSLEEAKRANRDSFYYTNIAPQHEAYNQSDRAGIWGRLEDAIFDDVKVEKLRISVMAGPVFRDDDPIYRGVRIPRAYWKLVAFKDSSDGAFKARAFVLSQRELLSDLETLSLDTFRIHQRSIQDLEAMTSMSFGTLAQHDASLGLEDVGDTGREISSIEDIKRCF